MRAGPVREPRHPNAGDRQPRNGEVRGVWCSPRARGRGRCESETHLGDGWFRR